MELCCEARLGGRAQCVMALAGRSRCDGAVWRLSLRNALCVQDVHGHAGRGRDELRWTRRRAARIAARALRKGLTGARAALALLEWGRWTQLRRWRRNQYGVQPAMTVGVSEQLPAAYPAVATSNAWAACATTTALACTPTGLICVPRK